jgi:hypothetical protein
VAFTGLLLAYFRQSKRRTALFLEALLNQPCGPALTVKMRGQVTAALWPPYAELAGALPSQPQRGIDESPTKGGAAKAWLWTFVGRLFTVFAVRGTRAAPVLADGLTDTCAGVVNCGRAKMSWALLDHGVEPTNNARERALRHAVLWRKLSFGTQSPGGSRFVETMLTGIETCRQQSRNVFA